MGISIPSFPVKESLFGSNLLFDPLLFPEPLSPFPPLPLPLLGPRLVEPGLCIALNTAGGSVAP